MPTAAMIALILPGGLALALGRRSLMQILEPGPDPDSAERLAQEILEAQGER